MPRFFVGTDQISDKDIVITGTDVNHIRNVLRMTPGEEVTVSDGQGMDYFCRIAELTKEEVRLDIVDSWHSFVELPAKIYLFQGLPKADKMELIIQKAVELGVYEIVPVATKRAVVKLDPKKEEKKRLRNSPLRCNRNYLIDSQFHCNEAGCCEAGSEEGREETSSLAEHCRECGEAGRKSIDTADCDMYHF